MSLFSKKAAGTYDSAQYQPVIRCSICTGEQVAGFRHRATGKVTDIMLLKTTRDLDTFRKTYGITGEIEKIY